MICSDVNFYQATFHQTNNSTYGQSDRSNGHPMGLPAVQIVHLKIAVNLTVRRKLATYR